MKLHCAKCMAFVSRKRLFLERASTAGTALLIRCQRCKAILALDFEVKEV